MIIKFLVFTLIGISLPHSALAEEHTMFDHEAWTQQHDTWSREHETWTQDDIQWKKDYAEVHKVMRALTKVLSTRQKALRSLEAEIKTHEAGINYHHAVMAENKITAEVRSGHYGGMKVHDKLRETHQIASLEHQQLMAAVQQLEQTLREQDFTNEIFPSGLAKPNRHGAGGKYSLLDISADKPDALPRPSKSQTRE